MKTTTKELIAAIEERGYITENEINLLNRRANAGDKEVDGIYDIDYLPLTCEKGIYSAVISDTRDADFNFKSRAVNIHVIEISRY